MTKTMRTNGAAATEPSEMQLRLAYRQLQHPDTWPPFEQALRHPVYGVCLRAMARCLNRPAWQPQPPTPSLPRGLPVPLTPDEPRSVPRQSAITSQWSRRRGIDFKKAAANDRDSE